MEVFQTQMELLSLDDEKGHSEQISCSFHTPMDKQILRTQKCRVSPLKEFLIIEEIPCTPQ